MRWMLVVAMLLPLAYSYVCSVYFTGIGCPHCAKTDPFIFKEVLQKHPNFVIIEYEIYQTRDNAQMILYYSQLYGTPAGVPLIIFSNNSYIIGDITILNKLEQKLASLSENPCPILDHLISFEDLNLDSLPLYPKIWRNNRIAIKEISGRTGSGNIAKEFITTENISELLKGINYTYNGPIDVPYSGGSVHFENSVKVDGWVLAWNGEPYLRSPVEEGESKNETPTSVGEFKIKKELTIPKIISLAAADSINPCALAVLTLMLISIMTYNPENKRNILLAGLSFTFAVFIIYFFYGIIIVKFFQIVQALTKVRLLLYKILAVFAIILGILNIKDFFFYRPGGILTEMPMSWRPKVKEIISKITSPTGAFFLGAFVTIFLLPCTIGPYVIAGGILSFLELLETVPWLVLYNIIFVLPMVGITLSVYLGIAKVTDVKEWRDRNIRRIHLVAGLIILLLGIGMLVGWF